MRKTKEYTVSRGVLTGRGTTKSEAKADLERQIDWALSHESHRTEIRNGMLIIVRTKPNGFSSAVAPLTDITDGRDIGCFSYTGQNDDFGREVYRARQHAAQIAWTHETDDEAYIPTCGLDDNGARELRSWIKFQRSYKQHRANGMTDAEAHRAACGY